MLNGTGLTLFDATMIAEGAVEAEDTEQMVAAWQTLVNTGAAWSLQGWFGRRAADLLRAGEIEATTDIARSIVEGR